VRATGPVNALTHQPIKGRKVGGGIRFGEMERDALLAHGCAFLLHDRLMRCSDYDLSYVCSHCGDLLAPIMSTTTVTAVEEVVGTSTEAGQTPKKRLRRRTDVCCRNKACIAANGGRVEQVALPFVFKYLVNELAAMNIRVTFEMKEH
jgi:DNA-directed RNA polymerase I subunit RPA2